MTDGNPVFCDHSVLDCPLGIADQSLFLLVFFVFFPFFLSQYYLFAVKGLFFSSLSQENRTDFLGFG